MNLNICAAFLKNPTCHKINCEVEPFWSTLYEDRDTCGWHHSSQHILEFDWDSCPSPEAAIAAVYHDANYDPQGATNEMIAANIAVAVCEQYFPRLNIERVINLIMSTRDHVNSFPIYNDIEDFQWLHKNDLAYLREDDISKIIATEKRLFIEYQHVPFNLYRNKRIEILQRYLNHPYVNGITVSHIISFLNGWVPNIGIYPGSFNPFHIGHKFILKEASKMFDKVIVAQGHNLDKPAPSHSIFDNLYLRTYQKALFVNIFDLIDTHKDECNLTLIRGIRNGGDLSDELTLQTFIRSQTDILCVNIFTSPELSHVSSGAIRQLDQLKVVHSLSV